MTRSFDITRLAEVQAKIGASNSTRREKSMRNSRGESSSSSSSTENPIHTAQQDYDNVWNDVGFENHHVTFCLRKGDYETSNKYKERLESL